MAAQNPSYTALHREVIAALRSGEPLPEPLRHRLLQAFDRAEQELSLDAGFGLSRAWWRTAARRRRDALIAAAHAQLPATLSLRQAAEQITRIARDLQSGRHHTPSKGPAASIQLALASGVSFPSTGRQLQNILREGGKSGRAAISCGDFAQ